MDCQAIAQEAVKLGAAQVESELCEVLEMIESLQPSVIVEIGCYLGGTLYAWRHACERVYGITLTENYKYYGGRPQPLETHGAVMHYGDSHTAEAHEWLTGELNGSPVDVLVIDADHRFEAVRQDFMAYAPLVRPGGLILLHDVLLRYPAFPDPDFQVWQVWDQLQERYETSVAGTEVGWGIVRVQPENDFRLTSDMMVS